MQTRTLSAVETLSSTAIGYLVAVLTQAIVFPAYGIKTHAGDHFAIAAIFTAVSIIRGYFVRRFFVWVEMKRVKNGRL